MGVDQAKVYIRRLRAEAPLRQQFELVWQGKRSDPDPDQRTDGVPSVPRALSSSIPDPNIDREHHDRWWNLYRAQRDMHDLLFSDGTGRDHAQRYLDGEAVTQQRILQVIDEHDTESALGLLARIASASTCFEIHLADMKTAWFAYVRWIYKKTDLAKEHPEVQRLRHDAVNTAALYDAINVLARGKSMSPGDATTLQCYLETGFAREGAYSTLDQGKTWLEAVAAIAREAGYDFSALDYLKDCICRQRDNDPGPEFDDRYWPEDDPNQWNYNPPLVHFDL